jgi:hypothetical protein
MTKQELTQFLKSDDIRHLLVSGKISELYTSAMWAFGSDKLHDLSKALLNIIPDIYKLFEKSIPTGAFIWCVFKDQTINIPKKVTIIEKEAFRNTNIKELHSESVVDFGVDCFQNCSLLRKLYIGKCCNFIASQAFDECCELVDIYYEGSLDDWINNIRSMDDSFKGINDKCVLHCSDIDVDFRNGKPVIKNIK